MAFSNLLIFENLQLATAKDRKKRENNLNCFMIIKFIVNQLLTSL